MTTRELIFDDWAPADGVWSPWAKPVLFAHIGGIMMQPIQLPSVDVSWAPPPDGSTAIVVDLPGISSPATGLELATRGYRPVPLYNACPTPGTTGSESISTGLIAAVDLREIIDALEAGGPMLRNLTLSLDAPPAFVLDANRRGVVRVSPGMFDNRSVSLPTDFPSANRLLSAGIRRVLVVTTTPSHPEPDLSHTLLRWQEAGIELLSTSSVMGSRASPLRVRKPQLYKSFLHRFLAVAGLRRHALGGFGAVLPIPSSGGGSGGHGYSG